MPTKEIAVMIVIHIHQVHCCKAGSFPISGCMVGIKCIRYDPLVAMQKVKKIIYILLVIQKRIVMEWIMVQMVIQ